VILADQPTAHQDADGAELIADVLDAAAAAGAAVLVTGRDPHLVAAAGRRGWRQLMIHGGQLVDVGDLADHEILIELDDEVAAEAIVGETAIDDVAAAVVPAAAAATLPGPAPAPAAPAAPQPAAAAVAAFGSAAAVSVPNVIAFPITARSRGAR
jgi:hypothetical protein